MGSVLINALLETATLEALANDNPAMSELGIDDDGTLIRLQPDDMQVAGAAASANLSRTQSNLIGLPWNSPSSIELEDMPEDANSMRFFKAPDFSCTVADDGTERGKGPRPVAVRAFSHAILDPIRKMPGKAAKNYRAGMLVIHPGVVRMLEASIEKFQHVTHFPMLVPPKPWTSAEKGRLPKAALLGKAAPLLISSATIFTFLVSEQLMRTSGSKLQWEALRLAHMPLVRECCLLCCVFIVGHLLAWAQVYEGLNVMGRVPWRINHVVHDTVLKVWEEGGRYR